MRYYNFKTIDYNNFEFCIGAHTRIEAFKKANECFKNVEFLGILLPNTVKTEHIDVIQIPYKNKKLYSEHIEIRI